MTASVIYVAYATTSIDLRWVPQGAEVVIVVNRGPRPIVIPNRVITWIEPTKNIGFGAGVNRAAAHAQGDRLIVVNPDCELTAAHWAPLAAASPEAVVTIPLESGNMATIVASRYPGPIDLVIGSLRLREGLRRLTGGRLGTKPAGGLQRGRAAPLRTHWVSGACVSIDRQRFLAVGGFSADYFLYYEDVDLCARLAARFPDMVAEVAEVLPGRHAVAASASTSPGFAAAARARSAATYARRRRGPGWRAAAVATELVARHADRAAPPTALTPVDVVVVSLGRRTSRGERRRACSWIDIAATTGRTATELRLLGEVGWPRPVEGLRKLTAVGLGRLVPEAMAWSTEHAAARIAALDPSLVVILTSRAYDERFTRDGRHLVLDYIDRLSDSYRDRAHAPGTRLHARLAWRLLANAHLRFERSQPVADLSVAAGLGDARVLDVSYVPITATAADALPSPAPQYDIAFVGNLRYPPNVGAVRELAALWPHLVALRPGTRLLLAGAEPGPEVARLANGNGWTVVADFQEAREVYRSTRLAVAPLPYASGIQTKVIDAMSHAVPVVAYPAAAAGFDPSAPITVVEDRQSLIERVVELLDDDLARVTLGAASANWVQTHLDPATWGWVMEAAAHAR